MENDLMHYVRRPSMPLPTGMLEAIGLDPRWSRRDYTWVTLTDAERDELLDLFPPTATVGAVLTRRVQMFTVAATADQAVAALTKAWHEIADDEDDDRGYLEKAIGTLTGPIGTVFVDGEPHQKGN